MANIVPFAFKGELASVTHNFSSGGDSFKIALAMEILCRCPPESLTPFSPIKVS